MCGLLGENGAGKSTLIKVMGGAHQADSGLVSVAGSSSVLGKADRFFRCGSRNYLSGI